MPYEPWNKLLAATGFTSYRYRGPFGWIMLAAHDTEGALREVARSTDAKINPANLQIWEYEKKQYVDINH